MTRAWGWSATGRVSLVLTCFISAQEDRQKAGQGAQEEQRLGGNSLLPSPGLKMGLGRSSESRAGRPFGLSPGHRSGGCRFPHLDPGGDLKYCWSLGTAGLAQPSQLTGVNAGPERLSVQLWVTQQARGTRGTSKKR